MASGTPIRRRHLKTQTKWRTNKLPEIDLAGRKLGTSDILVGAGLILGLITTFLPWYSASASVAGFSSSISINGFNYWSGVLFFIVVLIGLVFFGLRTFAPTVNLPAMPLTDAAIYLVIGVFMALMAVIYLIAATPGGYSGPGYSAGSRSVIDLIGRLGAVPLCGGFVRGCGFPILWVLGSIVVLVADVMVAVGGFRMYQADRSGKNLVIYGIVVAVIAQVVNLIGTIIAYSGLAGLGLGIGAGAII